MNERLNAGGTAVAAEQAGAKIDLRNSFSDLTECVVVQCRTAESNGSPHAMAGRIDREALFAEFAPLVRRLIGRYGSTPELRRDLPGEIYYRFCNLVNNYDPDRGIPLRPYLVRQLTAATYAYARQNWRIASREAMLDEANVGCGSQADPTASWVHAISQEQVAACLPEALARLPRRQRQIIIWRYYEERGFEEIAGILGVKPATVRSLLRHGLTALRKHMGAHDVSETKP